MTRILHAFANFVPGGSEMRAVRLINAFGGRFQHEVLSMDGRTSAFAFVADRDAVHLLQPPPPGGTPNTVAWLRRMLRVRDPDLVLTYGWGAFDMVIAAATLGLRHLVHHEDGFNADEAQRFKRRRIWARRWLLPRITCTVVPSLRLRQIGRELWRLPEARLQVIANGIETHRYTTADGNPTLRRRLGIPDGSTVVGTLANLRPEKNLPRLISACAAQPRPVHLLIIGDGPERAAIAAHAEAMLPPGRVHLVGHQAEPEPYLRALDLFALSSDTEQMPLSLLEAMASGLPAVCTDVGDIRAMLPGIQAPFVVAAPRLAEAMATVLADRPLARRLGEANRRHVSNHYDFATMVERYGTLYQAARRGG